MKFWAMTLTWMVAGTFVATTALAQSTGGGTTQQDPAKKDTEKKSETATTPAPSAPSASPSLPSDATKADKDAAKSDKKAERAGKGDRMAGGQENVRAAQQALKDKGHDPGPIDGVMGAKTQAAVRDFQKKEGIKESGRLDTDTMAKLGVDMKSSAAPGGAASPATEPAKPEAATKDPAKADKKQ